jgi:transposase
MDGYLVEGDILVVDNCAIYGGAETFDIFLMILQLYGIKLVYLPPYSPEFNPYELVFAQVKRFLCNHRDQSIPLDIDIATGFALVTQQNLKNYFNKCCRNYSSLFIIIHQHLTMHYKYNHEIT